MFMQVFRYMKEHGLPDESCVTYNATDYTKFNGAKECPPMAKCLNCMPIQTPAPDFQQEICWPVKTPLLYRVCTTHTQRRSRALLFTLMCSARANQSSQQFSKACYTIVQSILHTALQIPGKVAQADMFAWLSSSLRSARSTVAARPR
jgi:hypothetical protein